MKKEFKKILVAYDFSKCADEALARAVFLCAKWQSDLIIMHVIDSDVSQVFSVDISQDWQKSVREKLEELSQKINFPTTQKIETRVEQGDPATKIVATAIEYDADLILVGSNGRSALGYALLGHVADKVVRYSTVPVYVIRGLRDKGSRGLLPIELDCVTPLQYEVAEIFCADLSYWQLIHVVEDLPLLWGDFSSLVQDQFDVIEKKIRENLETSSFSSEPIILRGAVRERLLDYIHKNKDIGLVVLETHGRKGFEHFALGSTAESLVRYSECDVVAVPHPEQREAVLKMAQNKGEKISLGNVLF